jgi:hypothetical protein
VNYFYFFTYYIPSAKFCIGNFVANERKHPSMRSEDQLLANKSTRRSRGLLFDNNWSSDRIIYGCLSSLAKKLPILKTLHEGYTADYFLNRMKPNALFPILFIQNNLKKKIRYRHFLSDYSTVCI